MALITAFRMKNIALTGLLLILTQSAAAQDVALGHTESGVRLETLKMLAARFNAAQKGRDMVQLQALAAADASHSAPMALLNADDKRTYFASTTSFKPLFQVMKEAGQKLDSGGMYPQIVGVVAEKSGQLQALPLGYHPKPHAMWMKGSGNWLIR